MVTEHAKQRMLIPASLIFWISASGCGQQVEGKADRDSAPRTPYKTACTIGTITDGVQPV